jgi:hypothetical protein
MKVSHKVVENANLKSVDKEQQQTKTSATDFFKE